MYQALVTQMSTLVKLKFRPVLKNIFHLAPGTTYKSSEKVCVLGKGEILPLKRSAPGYNDRTFVRPHGTAEKGLD